MEKVYPRIATIIVTYNRSTLLKRCIDAVIEQNYPIQDIYIIDNASTDNTSSVVSAISDPRINYIKLNENIGGAGGFYTGMKIAHESGKYDALWVMDDDGMPSKSCLLNLVPYLTNCDFLSPAVIDIDSRTDLSFPFSDFITLKECKNRFGKVIDNIANPFNGVLFSSQLIDKIGYPKKEMFIWGDEVEYQVRAQVAGFRPKIILDAIHYHPKDRQTVYRDFLGKKSIHWSDIPWKQYCLIRNFAYRAKKYYKKKSMIYFYVRYSFFCLTKLKSFKSLRLFYQAAHDGRKEIFNRLEHYK